MRKRRLLAVLAGLALAVAAGVVVSTRPSTIAFENFSRIEVGMDRAQVLALLGPPVDNRSGPTIEFNVGFQVIGNFFDAHGSFIRGENLQWDDDNSQIEVTFSTTGKVVWATCQPTRRAKLL
jgi:hypothetical protein